MATTKTIRKKKAAKKAAPKKKTAKKITPKKKAAKKVASKKNKLGVKNSLVNNINKRKEKGISRTKKKSTIDKESYDNMEKGWKKSAAKKKK